MIGWNEVFYADEDFLTAKISPSSHLIFNQSVSVINAPDITLVAL